MKLMMDRLHIKSDDAFVKFKQTAVSNANQQLPGAPTHKQVCVYVSLYNSLLLIHPLQYIEGKREMVVVFILSHIVRIVTIKKALLK